MTIKRIAIVANKWWEANPLCAVLVDERARPPFFKAFKVEQFPTFRSPRPASRPSDPTPIPRLTFECDGTIVDTWCIEELMNPFESSSSSLEKARVLPAALTSRGVPDLVIAFGTASGRPGVSMNGGVAIGRRIFTHDPFAAVPNRLGLWTPPSADTIVDSSFSSQSFAKIPAEFRYQAEARFIPTPIAPANPPLVLLGDGMIALGVVNITNYNQYAWADKQAIAAFEKSNVKDGQIGSVETTHGVIRSCTQSPFLFVSGLVDMEGAFDFQVTPRVYSQNFVGAHNAAIALAWLIPQLVPLI